MSILADDYVLILPRRLTLAKRAPTVADRQRLQALSQTLLDRARDPTSTLARLPDALRRQVELVAADCVDVFVRASSCVEGRNGRLALLHHSLHRITTTKRTALTVIHNFFIQRSDGSTAAQRFFEANHANLFLYLLDHLDMPARSRSRRLRPAA